MTLRLWPPTLSISHPYLPPSPAAPHLPPSSSSSVLLERPCPGKLTTCLPSPPGVARPMAQGWHPSSAAWVACGQVPPTLVPLFLPDTQGPGGRPSAGAPTATLSARGEGSRAGPIPHLASSWSWLRLGLQVTIPSPTPGPLLHEVNGVTCLMEGTRAKADPLREAGGARGSWPTGHQPCARSAPACSARVWRGCCCYCPMHYVETTNQRGSESYPRSHSQ